MSELRFGEERDGPVGKSTATLPQMARWVRALLLSHRTLVQFPAPILGLASSIALVPQDLTPSPGFCMYQNCPCCTYMCAAKALRHIKKRVREQG